MVLLFIIGEEHEHLVYGYVYVCCVRQQHDQMILLLQGEDDGYTMGKRNVFLADLIPFALFLFIISRGSFDRFYGGNPSEQ